MVLFPPARILILRSPRNRLTMLAYSYRSSIPLPPAILPKYPWLFSSLMVKLIVLFCVSPSSPVNASDFVLVSVTCTFSIISLDRFLVVMVGSSPKNGFPLTSNLLTGFPLTVIFPSSSTSTPRSCCNRSSTFASYFVLKDFTLNSNVSFLVVIGALDVITTSFKTFPESSKAMVPNWIFV